MVNAALFSSNSDNWATPDETFDVLNSEFHFDVDVCASESNHKTPVYFDEKMNGLLQDWGASGFLQSAVFTNCRLGKKGIRRIIQTANIDCFTDSRTNGHALFSRLYIASFGNPIHKRPFKFRQQ